MDTALKLAIAKELGVDGDGLSRSGVQKSLEAHGYNEVPVRRKSRWLLFLGQFHNVMVYILLAAVIISFLTPVLQSGEIHTDEYINAGVILAIIVVNALLGFFQESKAENAIALLRTLSAPQVKVRRGGQAVIIPSRELVPGDLMMIEAGDKISADGRIGLCFSFEVNESSLTGESLAVAKKPQRKPKDHSSGMVFAGTVVTRGSAEVFVTATGLATEIGKITAMVAQTEPPPTPLQLELQSVGKRIGFIVLGLCSLIFIAGLLEGLAPVDMLLTAISLAVAAVPEGLPAIVTVCLALGVQRMIRRNALIRRLDAIETLGSVTVICADKTGTMTENRMKVTRTWLPDKAAGQLKLLAQAAASCNRAELPNVGDPTEIALLQYAKEKHAERLPLEDEEVPFTSEAKYMVTRHTLDGKTVRFYKGAPEVVVEFCKNADARGILTVNAEMAAEGLRVLGIAIDDGKGPRFLGLTGMLDPPRAGVKEAIRAASLAGIRTIMITGDSPVTAGAIARKVGLKTETVLEGAALEAMDLPSLKKALESVSVFARVQPAHKVRILEALQAGGAVVAMSGDGVNDAPALKRAHVGIAMGLKGTDVAREAGAMVLTDDNYATIVHAVAEGRRIYDNIQKFVLFLLRSNIGEVMAITAAIVLRIPLPLLPLHILWLNLVSDSFPALALAAEKGEHGVMQRQPRRRSQGLLTGEYLLMCASGIISAAVALSIFLSVATQYPDDNLLMARTATLTAIIILQMLLAFSTRVRRTAFLESPFANPWLLGAVSLSIGLHLILLGTPLGTLFLLTWIPADLWLMIIIVCAAGFTAFEGCKMARNWSVGRSSL